MRGTVISDDGSAFLASRAAGDLLAAAVEHAGGTLLTWDLEHIDNNPERSTTATYGALVEWPYGRREELLGVSARANGLAESDHRAEIFADGQRQLAVWLYPADPDLPGLARAAYADSVAALLNGHRAGSRALTGDDVRLEVIGYRPRRRAVIRADVLRPPERYYIKVLRGGVFDDVLRRHRLLLDAGVPAPPVVAATEDHLLVLRELPGEPLARALFGGVPPCSAEQLVTLLDSMPAQVSDLERRPPWSDAVAHYAAMVTAALPELEPRLAWLVERITEGLAGVPEGHEPTHGDFHEGQLHVDGGRIVGILDVDTIGPGRRADDLACLIAHLATIQHMNAAQAGTVRRLIADWVPVFDERVDPVELRLRAAAVIVSLATGPYRGQEPGWQAETTTMIEAAEALVRQVV
ncbi:phosphotransferase family protein [Nigerium massiliense]|uniref:phosphotransferase family protein n=1 Tax=Nigerium massiliense TaxID=1522317 RepID=UPI00058D6073|nr:phosphotransferase [Nigerium massiliense]